MNSHPLPDTTVQEVGATVKSEPAIHLSNTTIAVRLPLPNLPDVFENRVSSLTSANYFYQTARGESRGSGLAAARSQSRTLTSMAMGKRPAARQGSPLWVTTADLPTNAGHPFFERLNRVLEEAGFDAFVEGLCAVFYAARMGRPSLRPGRYFRMLLIGYFEGLSSERGIAWRVADSLSLRSCVDASENASLF